ncbi:MAG: hypothetical protein K6F95_05580 [Selenomonas sp.]|uniref:hypothetical protein n=1 Tax=Selenomonas sp. TaxID=2053611 RepID=UPI0025E18BA1|nr:hypothetical protein [Selenomonas sp.]MCR5757360.1 hypothetical protein [Selenomonas sp.]
MNDENLHAQRQKRALNIVWTAAGAYDFRPEFLSFYADGEPDLYRNSIVGLVHRHYDVEKLRSYIHDTLDCSLLGELFTELFWLGLESAAYERELPLRPVLADLRRQHAVRFLAEDVDLSLQQLMMRQELAHSLKCARCREILGQKPGLLNPWDRKIYQALKFTGQMNTEDMQAAMEAIIKRFFRVHFYSAPRKAWHFSLSPKLKILLQKLFPLHSRYGEEGAAQLQLFGGMQATGRRKFFWSIGKQGRHTAEELTRLYGAALFSPERQVDIEARFCRGIHSASQLWFTKNVENIQPENLEFFHQQQVRFRTELQKLAQRLQNALQLRSQPLHLPARSGRLDISQVWRGLKLQDSRVFTALEKDSLGDFSVVLLLDASDSRQGRQAVIAVQAYLLAMALGQAGIRLAAVSFFSQGGCTVLRMLKAFSDNAALGILSYKAQGWNRDGLAFRAVAELGGRMPHGRTLLFVLTDADPSDEQGIPAQGLGSDRLYGGSAALEDASLGVKFLREQGFQVLALVNSVLTGPIVTEAAQKIYGDDYICLHDLSSMAEKVGNLLEQELLAYR